MAWSRAFDDPITLPDGRVLWTLQDANTVSQAAKELQVRAMNVLILMVGWPYDREKRIFRHLRSGRGGRTAAFLFVTFLSPPRKPLQPPRLIITLPLRLPRVFQCDQLVGTLARRPQGGIFYITKEELGLFGVEFRRGDPREGGRKSEENDNRTFCRSPDHRRSSGACPESINQNTGAA
jgi:hypothetical protein